MSETWLRTPNIDNSQTDVTFYLPRRSFRIMSHVHNHEKRLSLGKSKHEVSHFPIFQTDVVLGAASQQAFDVDIQVHHNLPFSGVGVAELLKIIGYFSPHSICGFGPSPLAQLKEVLVNLR